MPLIEKYLINILCILGGIWWLIETVAECKSGETYGKLGAYRRDESPTVFWIVLSFNGLLALTLIFVGVGSIFF